MGRRRQHAQSPYQVFADQLMLMLGAVLFVAMIFMLSINPPAKKNGADPPKAEFLVTLSWDDKRDVDLDLWLEKGDCTIFYNHRECPNIGLDRDSLGYTSNQTENPDGTVAVSANQEIIAIRAIMPGDYIVGASYFSHGTKDNHPIPIDCRVELIKINPVVTFIQRVTLNFESVKQTQNALAFRVEADGSATILPLPADDMIGRHQRIQAMPQ